MTIFRRRSDPGGDIEGWTLYRLLEERLPLPDGGCPLGFEPLLLGYVFLRRSRVLLGNDLPPRVEAVLQIRPNAHGFIETEDEADRAVEYIGQPEVGAEPGLWRPWLLVGYPV